jgi:hypothetical protein
MGGGLLQLVACGAQDAYLSGNPQITFWKGLFKRHTNFAMEPFRINFTGQPNWGTKQSATINRNADLLYSTYLEVHLPHYDLSSNARKSAVYNNDQFHLGYNLIKYAELEIGGQLIDRQYGEWLFLWDTLCNSTEKSLLGHQLISAGGRPQVAAENVTNSASRLVGPSGAVIDFTDISGVPNNLTAGNLKSTASTGQVFMGASPAGCSSGLAGQSRAGHPNIIYVPLNFFYCRNPGAALPLISLQYHEVKINILWNDNQLVSGDYVDVPVPAQPTQAAIYVDYIYLDVEERRRMAQESHEYLIEQVQYNEDKGLSSYQNRIDLTFNHPVKELIWVVQPTCYRSCKVPIPGQPGNPGPPYTALTRGARYLSVPSNVSANVSRLTPFTYDQNAVHKQYLQINGQDRLDVRFGDYFNKVQPYQHHTGITHTEFIDYSLSGGSTLTTGASGNQTNVVLPQVGRLGLLAQQGIYTYSFALKPEEHQPSGTCNFSRIDTATLVLEMSGDCVVNQQQDATWDVRVYALNYNILRIMSGMCGLAYSN